MNILRIISATTFAIVASTSFSQAFAADAKFILDTSTFARYGFGFYSEGNAVYDDTYQTLLLSEANVSSNSVNFFADDGFSASGGFGALSFTNFSIDNHGELMGTLSGSILGNNFDFTGALMDASSVTFANAGMHASNFHVADALKSYLDGLSVPSSVIRVAGSLVASVDVPGLQATTAVPEPSSNILMLLGLCAVGVIALRTQRHIGNDFRHYC